MHWMSPVLCTYVYTHVYVYIGHRYGQSTMCTSYSEQGNRGFALAFHSHVNLYLRIFLLGLYIRINQYIHILLYNIWLYRICMYLTYIYSIRWIMLVYIWYRLCVFVNTQVIYIMYTVYIYIYIYPLDINTYLQNIIRLDVLYKKTRSTTLRIQIILCLPSGELT